MMNFALKMINLALQNDEFCIKNQWQPAVRGHLRDVSKENESLLKTRNCVSKLMNFAGLVSTTVMIYARRANHSAWRFMTTLMTWRRPSRETHQPYQPPSRAASHGVIMRNVALKTRNCVFKTRNFVFKKGKFCSMNLLSAMDAVSKNDEFCSKKRGIVYQK